MKKHRNTPILFLILLMSLLVSCKQTETAAPERKHIEDAVFASGYIEQENIYTVSAKAEGLILSLPVKEGDAVEKGDRISIIENDVQNKQLQDATAVYQDAVENASPDSPQLLNIETQIKQAQQQLEFDKENYQRYQELWNKESVSRIDFEKAELQYKAAQSNLIALQENYDEAKNALDLNVERSLVQLQTQQSLLSDYQLNTETSGIVINVFKKQGELVRRGEAIARIGSGDYLIKLFVSEEDITKVDTGQQIAVHLNTYPDDTYKAKVSKVFPAFDEKEQSYIVEAQFGQLPEKMFSGTQLQANIETGSRKNVLAIPTDYVRRGNRVTLANGEEKQFISGSKNSDWTEIISGISEKDVIVRPKN